MNKQQIPGTSLETSRLVYGCMLTGGSWDPGEHTREEVEAARPVMEAALECGINFYDHADIYCHGRGESVFGALMREGLFRREEIVLQTKCGIRFGGSPSPHSPHRYDFSYEHITESVDASLRRLQTDFVDILLLHRPDVLMEPEEVARAFDELEAAGKVRHFGVSNHTPAQIALLQRYVKQPLVANQIQASLLHTQPFESGLVSGYGEPGGAIRGDDTLEFCRLYDITVQAYSPLARGKLGEPMEEDADEHTRTVHDVLQQVARQYGVSIEAIAIAFLLRHPAKMQPILGTRQPKRLKAMVEADRITLDRESWYRLFEAGRGRKLP